jgi:hypothetical protein
MVLLFVVRRANIHWFFFGIEDGTGCFGSNAWTVTIEPFVLFVTIAGQEGRLNSKSDGRACRRDCLA